MLFNSFQFLIFFVVVTVLYYVINNRWRWLLLLLASCYFYMSFIPAYILVLFSIIIVDYIAAICMERIAGKKKLFLLLSITANVSVLAVFKYHNFFIENVNELMALMNVKVNAFRFWRIALPVGLSYHTFQAMSYTIEVYRGNYKAEKHFGIYALYVMFYPQLVAGPIERPAHLLPQFYEKHPVNYDNIVAGLKIMLWGFFMKVVVADRLSIYADYIFAGASWHSRSALLLGAFFYTFQIYGDFAGYSLIAVGAAKTIGFTLKSNFNQPFMATSVSNFWNRWHITLYSWFRDYLYIPLGGNRKGITRQVFNILFVFFLSGLWHGANWTFIVYGTLQGVIVVLELFFNKKHNGNKVAGMIYSFVTLMFCLIILRSVTLHDAAVYIGRIFNPQTPWVLPGEFEERALLLYSFFGIVCILAADIINEFYSKRHLLLYHHKTWVRLAACITIVIVILMLGVFDGAQFIYFKF